MGPGDGYEWFMLAELNGGAIALRLEPLIELFRFDENVIRDVRGFIKFYDEEFGRQPAQPQYEVCQPVC